MTCVLLIIGLILFKLGMRAYVSFHTLPRKGVVQLATTGGRAAFANANSQPSRCRVFLSLAAIAVLVASVGAIVAVASETPAGPLRAPPSPATPPSPPPCSSPLPCVTNLEHSVSYCHAWNTSLCMGESVAYQNTVLYKESGSSLGQDSTSYYCNEAGESRECTPIYCGYLCATYDKVECKGFMHGVDNSSGNAEYYCYLLETVEGQLTTPTPPDMSQMYVLQI